MHFLNWVLDKQEAPGNLGLFAKVVWNDINNGCGARYTSPVEWRIHFNKKHPKTAEKLSQLLSVAYTEYTKSLSDENKSK